MSEECPNELTNKADEQAQISADCGKQTSLEVDPHTILWSPRRVKVTGTRTDDTEDETSDEVGNVLSTRKEAAGEAEEVDAHEDSYDTL